jgi:hypothetical protein
MGKCKGDGIFTLLCTKFNLNAGSDMVTTDLYVNKCGCLCTLQWCEFGGNAVSEQVSTTAQNNFIPCECLPVCEQNFIVSGKNSFDTNEIVPYMLTISSCGKITFSFPSGTSFPVIRGGSASWIAKAAIHC